MFSKNITAVDSNYAKEDFSNEKNKPVVGIRFLATLIRSLSRPNFKMGPLKIQFGPG